MICCLVRHGKDDDSVRGGWSSTPLTSTGIAQVDRLAARLADIPTLNPDRILTSDLPRAQQTAQILSAALSLPATAFPEFRETNNGVLAGMDNTIASQKYPGLYWSALDWDQHYPGGESPHEFFDRIADAWRNLKQSLQTLDHDVILVTHGGVINVIQCIENGISYSNKANPYPVNHGEMVFIEL